MKLFRYILLAMVLLCGTEATGQTNNCDIQGTAGTDFWVTFLPNKSSNAVISIVITGENDADITINNPQTGQTQIAHHNGGTKTYREITTLAQDIPSATVSNRGYHITSTSPVYVFVNNYVKDSWDIANVLPTEALDTSYIVQDYYGTSLPPAVAMVATEDNTVVTMTLPNPVIGISTSQIGVPQSYNLNAGNSLLFKGSTYNGFCGMAITSNKPIAVFQGHSWQRVGYMVSSSGCDHAVEQARPLKLWGTEFLAASTKDRTEGDIVLISAGADNCLVNINGSNFTTLQRSDTCTYILPPNSTAHIVTSQPAYVCMYTWSYANGGSNGDPSSVSINPVNRWICSADFPVHNCNTVTSDPTYITNNHHYINIIASSAAMDSLRLDGQLLTGAQSISGGYKYVRMNVTPGAHTLRSSNGTFFAHVYGCAPWVQYNFELGLAVYNIQDTVDIYDTICQGRIYDTLGLSLQSSQTQEDGDWLYERNYLMTHYLFHITVLPSVGSDVYDSIALGDTIYWYGYEIFSGGDYSVTLSAENGCDSIVTLHVAFTGGTIHIYDTTCEGLAYNRYGFAIEETDYGSVELTRDSVENGATMHYVLHLEVYPISQTIIDTSIILGDTIILCDALLYEAGDYVFHYTNVYNCDSLVTVHLTCQEIGLIASRKGVCPGEEVTITALGLHTYIWQAIPADPEVDAQQGMNPIVAHPMQTTVYNLLNDAGNVIASVTVGTEPPPVLCVEVNHKALDFDQPILSFTDCSDGRYSTLWRFADGVEMVGQKVQRNYLYPLPDSAVVTMESCNSYDCCVDTTIVIPVKISTLWFPNVFTPEADNNNLFHGFTTIEMATYELVIYNRWGVFVWSSSDVNQGWDGRKNGIPCPQGSYTYRYFFQSTDGNFQQGIGTVTLLR